jgi:hypothetical protein
MKLIQLRNKENKIINQIINHGGEITDEIETSLEITKTEIAESIDAYAHVLKHSIKAEEQYWKDRKEEATKALKRIENNKDFLKQQLHDISTEGELVGEEYTIKPDTNCSRTVNYDIAPANIGHYSVILTAESFLRHFKDKPDDYIKATHKVLLDELTDHPEAIEETLTPTIKIVKTK